MVVGYRKAWNRTQSGSGGRGGGWDETAAPSLPLSISLPPFRPRVSLLCVLHVTQMDSFNLIVILGGEEGTENVSHGERERRDTKMVLAAAEEVLRKSIKTYELRKLVQNTLIVYSKVFFYIFIRLRT